MTCTTTCTSLGLHGSMRRFSQSHCTQVRSIAFVWKFFRQICWSMLRKDPVKFHSSVFHTDTNEVDSWWLYVTSGSSNGHAQAWYKSMFGDESARPEPVSFNENAV